MNKAKQFVACNHDGYVIGDAILFFLDENSVRLVGRPSAHNWVQYHAETGDYDVKVERDERTAVNPTGRREALPLPGAGADRARRAWRPPPAGRCPEIKFFNMGELTIAGQEGPRASTTACPARPGMELFGPWEDGEEVKAAIVEAGREFGLRQVGSRVYATNTLESGWIPCPLPAVFTGDEMKAYREWLPANGYEATGSLGGSYYSDDIEDYYLTPDDLGYGGSSSSTTISSGKEALEKMARQPEAQEGHAGLERRGRGPRDGHACSRRATRPSTSTCRCRTTRPGRTTRCCKDGEMVGVSTFSGLQLQRALDALAGDASTSTPRSAPR